MIICPRCQELNADSRSSCFRCGTKFSGRNIAVPKHCPHCGESLTTKRSNCPSCGSLLERGSAPTTATEQETLADYLLPEHGALRAMMKGDKERTWELYRRSLIVSAIVGGVGLFIGCLLLLFGG